MKKSVTKALCAVSSAVILSGSAAGVFPGLSAAAVSRLFTDSHNPCDEDAVTYRNGYIYRGDINKDGKITDKDADDLEMMIYGMMSTDGVPFKVADVNDDGEVDDNDVDLIKDFANSEFGYGDVNRIDGLTNIDGLYIEQYLNGEKPYIPFLDYIGDVFNRGDGLTAEDRMVIASVIDKPERFIYSDDWRAVPEWDYDERTSQYMQTGNTRYAGNGMISTSVSLDGTLGLNFYIHISAETEYIILDGPNGKVTYYKDQFPSLHVRGEGFSEVSKVTYPINAVQARENVEISFEEHNNAPSDIWYLSRNGVFRTGKQHSSVRSYIDNYKSEGDTTCDALVAALGNYCSAAEGFFNNQDRAISGIDNVTLDDFTYYDNTFDSNLSGSLLSLVLDSGTALRIYFPLGSSIHKAEYKAGTDTALTAAYVGAGKYGPCIEIPNIPAHKLLSTYSVRVNEESTSKVIPINYVKRVLENSSVAPDSRLAKVSKALYVYAKAAQDYVNSHN